MICILYNYIINPTDKMPDGAHVAIEEENIQRFCLPAK